jgi:hypothetical protein
MLISIPREPDTVVKFERQGPQPRALFYKRGCGIGFPLMLSMYGYGTKNVIMRYEGSAFAFCTIRNNNRSFAITQDDIILDGSNLKC